MFKITIEISDKQIDGVMQMIEKYFGLTVTPEYVEQILLARKELIHEVVDNAYTDTYVRDIFSEHIANDLTGMSWPLNCDKEEYSQTFWKKLKRGAKRAGFKIRID